MKDNILWRAAAVLLLGSASFAQADQVYGNFSGDLSDPLVYYGIQWNYDGVAPDFGNSRGVAARFNVPVGMSYRLDSVTLALGQQDSPVNLEVSLLSNNAGLPGSLLEILAVNPLGLGNRQPPIPSTFTSSLTPVLQGGSSYWLLVQPHDWDVVDGTHNAVHHWNINFSDIQGPVASRSFDFQQNTWEPWNVFNNAEPAFRVDGTAIPEPSTWALLTLGSALFWFAGRRRRK